MTECRRRKRSNWKNHPIARILTKPDDVAGVTSACILAGIRRRLSDRGLLLADAYRIFDCDRNGVLSPEEFYGGVTWLGIDVTPAQISEIVEEMVRDRDSGISFSEFSRVISDPEERIAMRSVAWITPSAADRKAPNLESNARPSPDFDIEKWNEVVPRSLRPEESLRSYGSKSNLSDRVRDAASLLKVSLRKVGGMASIWDSSMSGARMTCTVWCPKLPSPSAHRIHICVGHYASQGFGKIHDEVSRMYVTLTDTTSWRVFKSQHLEQEIVDFLMPHPIRYVEVWRHKAEDRQLFIWRPIPPSPAFVALGMLASPSDDPPDVTECRCVPKPWVTASTFRPNQIWKDAGGGGRPGSFWALNSLGLLQGTEQHSLPKGEFYDLRQSDFMASHGFDEIDKAWRAESGGGGGGGSQAAIAPPPRQRVPRHLTGASLEDREKAEYLKQKSLLSATRLHTPSASPSTSPSPSPPRPLVGALPKFYVCDLFPGMSVDIPTLLEDALYRPSENL